MDEKVIIDKPSGSYWDCEGKYQGLYDLAWQQLIPIEGEAEDGWPELLRAISRIGYDYYNNGFGNLWREWEEYDGVECYTEYKMDSYYEELVEYIEDNLTNDDLYKELRSFMLDAQGYGNWSDHADIIDRIIDYIMEGIIEDDLLEAKWIRKELVD